MIGPVSQTGRAMMASLQQAMSKGMPPDQAIQYVKSMAMQGVAPLTDLYAMVNQFQRLKQQQVQPPQTPPTIKDQLNMLDQQQRMQDGIAGMQAPPPAPEPMDRGLGAVSAGNMEYPQFAGGGIVAFSNGGTGMSKPYEFNDDLENTAGSVMKRSDMDIVSFVKAQMPNFDMLTPQQKQEVLRQFEPMYTRAREARLKLEGRGVTPQVNAPQIDTSRGPTVTPASVDFARENVVRATSPFAAADESMGDVFSRLGTRVGETPPAVIEQATTKSVRAPVAPAGPAKPKTDIFTPYERKSPDLEAIRSERIERQRAGKTGEFSQADADMVAYINEQKERFGTEEKEARNNFWVMTGAALMANKSPSFLAALGESIQSNYGGLVKDLRELKRDQRALRLQEIQLRQAKEQAVESGAREDQARYDRLYEQAQSTNLSIASKRSDIHEKMLDRDNDRVLRQISQLGNDKAADELNRMYKEAIAIADPLEREAALVRFRNYRDEVEKNVAASTAGGVAAKLRAETAADTRLANLVKTPIYMRMQRIAQNPDSSEDERRQAEEAIRVMEAQAVGTMGAGPRIAQDQGLAGGAYTGPYSSSGWDQ